LWLYSRNDWQVCSRWVFETFLSLWKGM